MTSWSSRSTRTSRSRSRSPRSRESPRRGSSLRVLFLGTPDFAATVLSSLLESKHEVVGVMTQPPRPTGRGLQLSDPPAARLARAHGVPVFQPEKIHRPESLDALRAVDPEIIVTAAFGRILRKSLLQLPPRGCWNVHTSLLPRHRGAAPVPAAILAGDSWTGVTLFELDAGMDTGPLLAQRVTPIGSEETAGALTGRLAQLGGELLVESLTAEERASLPRLPQPEDGATYTRMLAKEDGRVPWNRPAEQVDRWIRAVTPWPGAFSFVLGRRVIVHRAEVLHTMPLGIAPGTVVATQAGIDVACLPGAVRLTSVQQEGKRSQPADAWARGARLGPGSVLGTEPADSR
ncbi:MAG: methionyl-tRNA formyltransferase [Candidatus Eisenbacteria bacterium]|uniref:Methionyl-tRNA formyltransferase n=1 Tax=Eiseniibacteriota bacterium TaxID=2212470 RepID=A0A956LW33_UNCEI|nr:methionyl-tRNA formyltransferase [Candidatus Eisenbacteria bacterium]